MKRKVEIANKLYPWFSGLSADLIFYIAISSIWLTTIKGFNPAEITFLYTISSFFCILFQIPSLSIIKKLGNTKSIRVGSVLLLLSSIMVTFCTNYISFAIANIFLEMSLVFETMSAIIIKNNLNYLDKNDEYIHTRNKAGIIYAISTAIITLFSGILFNIHAYLPMILGILTCLFCFIISFFIFDIDEEKKETNKEEIKLTLPKPLKLFIYVLLFYGIFYGILTIGQQNGQLLIQYELSNSLSLVKVTNYLAIILFTTRIIRIITNWLYPTIYKKLNNKVSIIFSLSLLISCVLLLLGFYLDINFYIKVLLLTIGFSIYPSLREPVKIYTQNLILTTYSKKYHKDILVYMSLAKHIGTFLFSLFASFILLKLPIQQLFIALIFLILPMIVITTTILKTLKK